MSIQQQKFKEKSIETYCHTRHRNLRSQALKYAHKSCLYSCSILQCIAHTMEKKECTDGLFSNNNMQRQ